MDFIAEFKGPYRFLSNFYPARINYLGIMFDTTEHAFQAAKACTRADAIRIASIIKPGDAKRAGKKLELLRPDWEQVKELVMLDVLRLKFQHPDLRRKLLETGTAHLQEGNTWDDTYWGVCDGQGLNRLGVLLMKVRDEVRHG
jgi:hypothetical protein